MREGAGAGRGEAKHLKPVRQRAGVSALSAIFDVVMDRVIVAGHGPERGKIGLGHRAARDVEPLADLQVLEIPALRKLVLSPVEAFSHVVGFPTQRATACSAACTTRASISASLKVLSG